MSGKVLIQWRHTLCAEISKSRYMDPDTTRAVHTEIANIFFNQDADDSDETSTVNSDHSGELFFYRFIEMALNKCFGSFDLRT